jgi:hypothetical protein
VEEIGGGQRGDTEVRHFLETLKEKQYIGEGGHYNGQGTQCETKKVREYKVTLGQK